MSAFKGLPSWQRRRERARERGGLVTNRLPAWMEMGDGGVPRLVPERAAAVRRIFQMAGEGMGLRRILAELRRIDDFVSHGGIGEALASV